MKIRELRKSYDERQLSVFIETAKVAGQLSSLELADPEWKAAKVRFCQLYWSELAMMQNTNVEEAMFRLDETVRYFEASGDREPLTATTFCLALQLKYSTEELWSVPKQDGTSVHYNEAWEHCIENISSPKKTSK